jgi:hypothetical protein
MITLKPVGTNSVTIRYARDMGNNKVRHYVLPLSLAVVKKFVGQDAYFVIRDYIKRTEGETDVVFMENNPVDFFDVDEEMFEKKLLGKFLVTDVSKMVLGDEPGIGRALTRVKSKSILYVWTHFPSVIHKTLLHFTEFYNGSILPHLNKFLYRIQGQKYDPYAPNPFVKQLRPIEHGGRLALRRVDPAHFISVAFEANDAEEAVKAFKADLRTLYKKKLILGNLCMPSIMGLTDMVGLGKYYTIFCFPIIDHHRLMKLAGKKSPLEMPDRDQLSFVGVKYETLEGDIKWLDGKNTTDKFEIEEVFIKDLDAPDRQQMVLQAYSDSVEHVNAVASKMRENLKDMEKVHSGSHTVIDDRGKTHVILDAEVVNKKTGMDLNVAAHYNRNKND